MSEYTNERPSDDTTDLNLIREQCGTLELALQTETDPARLSDLHRELAECRQRAFEAEPRPKDTAQRAPDRFFSPGGVHLPKAVGRGGLRDHQSH